MQRVTRRTSPVITAIASSSSFSSLLAQSNHSTVLLPLTRICSILTFYCFPRIQTPCYHHRHIRTTTYRTQRYFATASVPASGTESNRDDGNTQTPGTLSSRPPPSSAVLAYQSPFCSAVKRMKLFSFSSMCISLMSAPVMVVLASPNIPLSGRIAVSVAVAVFGIGTTVALTMFTKPYALRVYRQHTDDNEQSPPLITFETLNMFARPRFFTVPLSSVHPLHNRLLSNLRAGDMPESSTGVGTASKGKKAYRDYFVHADGVEDPWLKPLVQHAVTPAPEQTTTEEAASDEHLSQTAAPTQSAQSPSVTSTPPIATNAKQQ